MNPSTASCFVVSRHFTDTAPLQPSVGAGGASFLGQKLSHSMGKTTICEVTAKLISAFVFATRIVPFLYFLNLKFPASNHLL